MDGNPLVLIRWGLCLASAALLLGSRHFGSFPMDSLGLLGAFAASNIVLQLLWKSFVRRPGTHVLLAIVDTLFLSLMIESAGIAPREMFLMVLLVVLIVALGRGLKETIAAGVGAGVLYILAVTPGRPSEILQNPGLLVHIPFFYCVALYFGCFAARAVEEQRRARELVQERRELAALMEVIETINSSLDLHAVMLGITTKLAEAVNLSRCSVLLVENERRRGIVIASNDRPEVDRLEIELAKYPEVRRAIETRSPVVIEDVLNHPLMADVRQLISGAGFNAILVVPMVHRNEMVGTLLLRAATREAKFNARVVNFCQAVASASAHALKNALLYTQVREEAALHRSTAEKLQNILEHSMDIIVTTDLDGTITDFNRSAEESLGFRRDEMIGKPLTEIYKGFADRAQFLSTLRAAGRIDDRGATMTSRDGSRRTFDLTVAVVRNELGEVVGSVCVGKKPYSFH